MFNNNPFEGAFGLDIGDLSLKLVQLSPPSIFDRDHRYKIAHIATITLPPGYIVNGEIQQPEMVRHKLLQLLGRDGHGKKIKSPWVVADLPEPKTFLTSIEIDMPPEQITKDDIEYQCQKHLPFDISEAYLDWQIIQPLEKSRLTRVLIGATQKTIADSYTYLLESVGLQPIALEVESLAIARSLMNDEGASGAILDIGATRSSIIIYDAGGVRFSTTINFSGEIINMSLIQQLKITYDEAEDIKIKNGLNYTKEIPSYLKIVDELVDNLILEIKKTISYYQDHYPHATPIEHIELCGGMAQMQNILPTLARRLKIKFTMGNGWKNIKTEKFTDEQKKFHEHTMVSATGLALRAVINPYNE
ncbi:MAG: pilus assembly protein PilM [Candidatus Magasanikbacteria bacterium]